MMGWVTAGLKLLPLVFAAITAVEKFSTGRSGKDKQDAAVELVGDLVPVLEAGIGKDIVNDGDVQDAIRKVIDAVVAFQNVVRDVQAKRKAA